MNCLPNQPFMKDLDPKELAKHFQAGHKTAFEQVFRMYYKPLRLQAFLILKNEADAEDQVQQLFIDIWNQRLYRNVQQSLKAYLHTAIRNRCLNFLRKASRDNQVGLEYAGMIQDISLAEEVLPGEPAVLVALNELPVQRQKAFHLVHIQEMKYHEAAKEMGISINSLKSHLKLALKFLRVRLKTPAVHPYNK